MSINEVRYLPECGSTNALIVILFTSFLSEILCNTLKSNTC